MQQIKCARSLLTCWPSTVQSFSAATSLVMNPLQGKRFVLGYDQRKRAYGMRTLACYSMGGEYALNRLKGIINMPILYDGSTQEKVDINVLDMKNLYLLFSRVNVPGQLFDSLRPVHKKLHEQKKGVIVWIPVEDKEWTECDQKNFDLIKGNMPWYAIKCFPFSKYMKRNWHFNGEPIVTGMNMYGEVGPTVELRVIKQKGDEAFPFLA